VKTLLPEEREFFALVAEIAFTNPFSDDRRDAEVRVAHWLQRPVSSGNELLFDAILPALDQRLAAVERRGIGKLQQVRGQDRSLLDYAWLFQIYHRRMDDWNRHIQDQLSAGDQPIPVPMGREIIDSLRSQGRDRDEALRYMALFFQLRRAFWFIDVALVGDSPCMGELRRELWDCVFTSDVRAYEAYLWNRMEDFSTLILGETGTGKGTAAAAIGRSGLIPFNPERSRFEHSFTATFTSTNLSEYPESLIESELFGHRKGSFTGAVDDHQGLFTRCSSHGALFLDEIGDISTPIQLKLLRVLQERRFSPVGSRKEQRFSGRVIAATNRPLEQLIEDGRFRADFYYRLCSAEIEVPTLRKRLQESPEEMERMVSLLVERLTGTPEPALAQRISDSLRGSLPRDYAWPGNVRELEQAVRRVLLGTPYQGLRQGRRDDDPLTTAVSAGSLTAGELLALYCGRLYRELGSYEAVAKRVALDRRTVKKYVDQAQGQPPVS
jgi:MoxR-like ATPase